LSKKIRGDIVEIEIYDQRYPVRVARATERKEILRLAEIVDARMREIARQTGTVDSLKVAILTALHLAQESGNEGGVSDLEAVIASAADKWITEIDRAL
jgi:cell division protein ZapA (FtsZ GTPase activity inhibitor)